MDKVKNFPPYEEASKIAIEKGIKSWDEYKAQYKELGLPSNPHRTYKEEWIDWPSFFGKEKKSFPSSYEEAKRIIIEKGIKSQTEYRTNCKELGLPAAPDVYYRDKGWVDWSSFLGKEKVEFPSYKEAKRRVIEGGIKSAQDYRTKYKELGLPPKPQNTYKGKGWVDWFSFLEKEKKSFPSSYEEAKRRAIENGIKSQADYKAKCIELSLPSHPDGSYKDKGWVDWPTFLGKKKKSFPSSYEEAKRIVIEKGIKSLADYNALCEEFGLPSHPDRIYKGKGWVDWGDFFGRPHKITLKERRAKVLSRLSLDPILLDDKASLQVLYMVASCVDKDLAREIETLLDSSTPEDRLNWVKEQLKDVKEETTSRDGTTSASPNEGSAMESMMDVFEDTFEDLSEEDSTNIQIILENYYHNVINKELIGECDG